MGLAALATLAFVGCASETELGRDHMTLDQMVGAWVVEGGEGPAGDFQSSKAAVADLTVEADGSYHGSTGCNSISGRFTVTDGVVDVGEPAWTEMGCEGVAMKLEDAYLPAFLDVTTGTVSGDLMNLEGPDTMIHYVREP